MGSYTDLKAANGTTYVYWQESHWDKARKMSIPIKVCIGKRADDGTIIYNKKYIDSQALDDLKRGVQRADCMSIGQSMVLERALSETSLDKVLHEVFEEGLCAKIISLAYCIVATDSRMYAAEEWMRSHQCPCHERPLSSPRVSETFASITPSEIETFLNQWMTHLGSDGYYCFDVTSISSANADNPFVEWGYNRDRECLPQINIALLSSITTRLPALYTVTPGSVSDVTCIRELDERFAKYGASGIRLVLDRGFYSAANLEDIVSGGGHFMMPVPGSVNLARDLIDGARAEIESDLNFVEVAEDGTSAIYGITKVDKVAAKRVWHHIYFDTARRVEHISAFFAKLATWEAELRSKRTKESNQTFYAKYFIVKTTPKRGYQVRRNMETINEYKQDYAGYWVITTNFEKDAASALELYRKRAAVEQHYDDLKNELDMMRLRTHRQETMRGRIFVHFIALILLQQLRKTATDSGVLKRDLSIRAMMKKLDSYQRVHFAGKYRDVFSTMTKSQREILAAFGLGEE